MGAFVVDLPPGAELRHMEPPGLKFTWNGQDFEQQPDDTPKDP